MLVYSEDQTVMRLYPTWICSSCGAKYGRRMCGLATWHTGTCDLCGIEADVTEPRDYGHLRNGWAAEAPTYPPQRGVEVKADLERYAAVARKARLVPCQVHTDGKWRKQWDVEVRFSTQENAEAFLAAVLAITPTSPQQPPREP